ERPRIPLEVRIEVRVMLDRGAPTGTEHGNFGAMTGLLRFRQPATPRLRLEVIERRKRIVDDAVTCIDQLHAVVDIIEFDRQADFIKAPQLLEKRAPRGQACARDGRSTA